MLIIDANMFRLAKMLEALLKVSVSDRDETLSRYMQIVSEIDAKAFQDIMNEIKRIDEHNQSLEDELIFLEGIEKTYDQLLELQSGFKSVCEKYCALNLRLSDLSVLNIGHIRERLNAIKGFLTNIRNIDINRKRIDELTEQLVEQEKNRDLISRKIFELEKSLRENFSNVEGRRVENGRLVPTSVVLEYQKIDLDFDRLLSNIELLDDILSKAVRDRNDALETLKTAEICYNSVLTAESKQFLEDAKKEYLRVEYRLTMIKILKLLSQCFTDYDDVKKKREDLLELIEYRFSCLTCLGIAKQEDKDLDPFCRTKVREQLNIVLTIVDVSKDISRISTQISELVKLTEEMVKQKNENQIALTNTKSLVESRMSMNDIDITGIKLPVINESKKSVLSNQVIGVRMVSKDLNREKVTQKAAGVISRVNEMMNKVNNSSLHVDSSVSPELVIIPTESNDEISTLNSSIDTSSYLVEDINDVFDGEIEDDEQVSIVELPEIDENKINADLFETISPFTEPVIFSDRSEEIIGDDILELIDNDSVETINVDSDVIEFPMIDNNFVIENSSSDLKDDEDDDESGSFWVSHSNENIYSDEQIGNLLSLNTNDNTIMLNAA